MFSWVGRQILALLSYLGRTATLQWEILVGIFKGKLEYGLAVAQLANVGVASLPVVAITMVFSGMVIAYHMAIVTGQLGVSGYAGRVVAETMARELGPVLVAFVVAARAGSAMAAELGTMKVTEQLDALRAMGTNPVDYLALPRWVACAVMVPLLTFVGDVVGVTGGYLTALTTPLINAEAYWTSIPGNFEGFTLIAGIGKSLVFGIIIAVVSCGEGMNCRMASEDVGRATTRAVVYSIVLVYAANLFLTTLIFRG